MKLDGCLDLFDQRGIVSILNPGCVSILWSATIGIMARRYYATVRDRLKRSYLSHGGDARTHIDPLEFDLVSGGDELGSRD